MRLIPLLGKIFKYNVSYMLILPLFDKFNIKIVSANNKELNLGLIQYLSYFNVKNTWLYYKNYENYLWFETTIPHSNNLQRVVINEFNPYLLFDVLSSKYDIITIDRGNTKIWGLPIPENLLQDIQKIRDSKYYSVSQAYYQEIIERNTIYYYDNSIESTILHHRLAKNILRNSSKLRQVMEKLFDEKLIGKQLFGKFNKDNETLVPEKIEEHINSY